MNPLYLSTIELRNFRSFGFVPPIELHPGPGAVILVGANGLGKSSWFEAVEAALTGGVRRWDALGEMPPQAQARLGSTGWSVSLDFQDGAGDHHRVLRSGPEGVDDTPVEQVISILSPNAEAWSLSRTNLRAFLHMTHFLPQSSRLRFLSEPSHRARWDDWLSQVCGFERVLRAQTSVGQGTKRLIGGEVKARAKRREDAQQNVDRWLTDRLALQEAERVLLASGEVWPPERVRSELLALHRVEVLPAVGPDAAADAMLLTEALSPAAARRAAAIAQIGARIAALEALRPLPGERTDADQRLADARADLMARGEEEASATAAMDEASGAVVTAREAKSDAEKKKSEVDRLVAAIGARRAAEAGVTEASAAAERADSAVWDARERLRPLQATHQDASARLAARKAWDAVGSALAHRAEDLVEARRRLGRARAVQIEKTEAQVEDLVRRLGEEQEQLDRSRAEEQEAARALQAAEQDLELFRARNTAIAQAVAALAVHVQEADTTCPLCTHDWEHPGLLHAKIRAELDKADPVLSRAEDAVARQRDEVGLLRARVVGIIESIRGLDAERAALQTAQSRRRDELRELRDHPLLVEGNLLDLDARLASVEATLDLDREAWSRSPSALLPSVPVLQGEHDVALSASQDAERDLGRLEASLTEATARVTAATAARSAAIIALGDAAPGDDASDAALEAALVNQAGATARVATTSEQLTRDEERLRMATAAHAAAQERRRSIVSNITLIEAALTSIRTRWAAAGLVGEPEQATIQAALDAADRNVGIEREDEALLGRALAGLARWRSEVDFGSRRRQLNEEAGGPTEADWEAHHKRLVAELDRCSAAEKRAMTTRSAVDQLSRRLDQVVTEFRPRLVASLAEPLSVLLPAMIQDERFHRLRLNVDGTGKKSEVAAMLPESHGIEADHLLSEGQLSGVSLAVMLAMASAYRWSRWPGLLLDDPAQHNDLVHAANLIDVLRTMIIAHGFQVVLSTHDRELADFFQRKLRHAGVPGRTCAFRDPDPAAGVVPSVTAW